MGAGLAKAFADQFDDEMVPDYVSACKSGSLRPGRVQLVRIYSSHYAVVNFPTKDDWRQPSRLEWIESGLESLRKLVLARGITSIALPKLGCGLGGLDWRDVKPLIERYLSDLVVVDINTNREVPVRVDVYA
jgi:O-acetyl-ADP-ribose deacetylase (regulator of RNase III)